MKLYVDGAQVAVKAGTTVADVRGGYWRIGGDDASSITTNKPTNAYLTGSIDEVAIFPTAISASQIAQQYSVGSGVSINTPPSAAFTSYTNALSVDVDGSPSTDVEGPISSYSWNFGDGTAATIGAQSTHAYAAGGTYTVQLTVTDAGGLTDVTSTPVTVTAANKAPTAKITASMSGATATLSGAGSTDADGTIANYAWNFGDGTTGTGVSVSHTYTAYGSFTVTLLVTDNAGAKGSATTSVTASAVTAVSADAFGRTQTGGWGTADAGGTWTPSSASLFSVANGKGALSLATAGSGPSAVLAGGTGTDLRGTVDISFDKAATGGGTYASFALRRVSGQKTDYRAKVLLTSAGTVQLSVTKLVANVETAVGPAVTLTGVTYSVGDTLRLRFEVTGTGTTTLTAKAWKIGQTEPIDWQINRTDATPELQVAGGVALAGYLSGSSTQAPTTVLFDNLSVTQ